MAVAVFLAAGIGVAVAAQASILASAGRSLNPLAVSLALQVAGLAVGLAWGVFANPWSDVVEAVRQWWWLPLGALGLGVVAALGYSSARLGVASTLAVVVASQLVAGLAADGAAGRVELDVRAALGVILLVGGVLLVGGKSGG